MKQLIEDLEKIRKELEYEDWCPESIDPIRKAIEELSKQPDESFIEYIKNERDSFCKTINEQEWNTEMRKAAEDLLIAYDQLAVRLKPTGRMYSEEEVRRAFKAGKNYGNNGLGDFYDEPNEDAVIATLNAKQDASLTTPDGDK